jgi:uncharacterized membrane protein
VSAGWLAVRWLHVLAMALFVGGQILLVVAVVPALRASDRAGLRAIARRFGWASLGALAVLAATGSALAAHDGVWDSGTLHVKLALVVIVAALIAWHVRRPGQHAIEAVVFLVSLAIVWLGLALAHGPLPFSAVPQPTGGVPYVWKLSTVCTPQACPLARSASVQTTHGSSGA